MDRVYVESCGHYSKSGMDWNGKFQLALEMDDGTSELALRRQEEIASVERDFEAEASQGAIRIVTMNERAPCGVPKELLCYREKNIFYRVLPDGRTGRNIAASFRGILQSRSALLTVPLTAFFMYRGTPVLAQAIAPLGKDTIKVYGENSANSSEVGAEVEIIADAINTPLPDQVVCEVYQGLDGRMYVTNTNVTTIALDDSTLLDGPLKRSEMLVLCPCVTATCEDTLNVLQNPSVMEALLQILAAPVEDQPRILSDTLHFYGVNLCLLKAVLDAFRAFYGEASAESHQFMELIAKEMIARTIKQEFYTEVQAKRLGIDDIGISKSFGLHLRDAFKFERTEEKFMPLVMRKYAVVPSDESNAQLVEALYAARRDHRSAIVERVSWLVGARAAVQTEEFDFKKTVVWVSIVAGRVSPRVCDPKMTVSLDPLYRATQTNEAHCLAFCYPVQIKAALWEGRFGDALNLASAAFDLSEQRYGPASLRAMQALRTFTKLLFAVPSIENVKEGCARIVPMLEVYQDRACNITRARCHIEVGCCLVGASSTVNLVDEAFRHFREAEGLLPISLRSSHGAWLYIQPSLGLLRCQQMGGCRSPLPFKSLVSDAMLLSKIVGPADFYVEYLWELGMELSGGRHYEEATQLLTNAYAMSKRVPRSHVDSGALRSDALDVYREWDPERYAAYCDALAQYTT